MARRTGASLFHLMPVQSALLTFWTGAWCGETGTLVLHFRHTFLTATTSSGVPEATKQDIFSREAEQEE